MLNTEKEIIEVCEEQNKTIADLVMEEEIATAKGKKTEADIREYLRETLKVMESSAMANLEKSTESKYNMIDGFAMAANKASTIQGESEPMSGSFMMRAMAMAFSTSEINCAMGKIVAAPTAGSSGILPAAMMSAKEKYGFDQKTLEDGLLTAIAVGKIIAKYSTFAGAEGGCQAECGSAAAMASAALVSMRGGSASEALTAASICFVNVMGLICDPIAGLVQYPCTFRNSSGVVNAITSADLALAGVKSIVPFEEVVQATKEVGDALEPEFRETGLGGLAGTRTGQRIREQFMGSEAKE